MKRILPVLLNPFLLSLWAALFVIFIFPLRMEKYLARMVENGTYENDYVVRYDDLDNDGSSEKIAVFHNSLGHAGLTISNTSGVLDQWTFRGFYGFAQRYGTVLTGDRDDDGTKEVYVFTLSGDSVLLHTIVDYKNTQMARRNRFVARIGLKYNKADPYIIPAEMNDITQDGCKELIFGIGTGYSLFPRRVFAYDAAQDTFLSSPESGYFLMGILQEDITGDDRKEIIPYGYAASNIHDSTVPYPDRNSWLMVLNQKLQFIFEPVAFPGQYSGLKPVVLSNNRNEPVMVALYRPPENLGDSNLLLRYDKDGRMLKKISVPVNTTEALSLKDKNGKTWILLCRDKEGFYLYDTSFVLRKSVPADLSSHVSLLDVDLDGTNEVAVSDLSRRKMTVYRNELNHPTVLPIPGEGGQGLIYSLKKENGKVNQWFLQAGNGYSLFEYGRNPKYNYKYLIYAAIYLSILVFTVIVRRIQQVQIRRKQATEKKITDLQLQIVRNQLDPHFIMNAINSIIISITERDKEEAKKQLLHFSRLHRSLLLSSDQIQRSLQEEIEFTENYLALEKFRFREKFDYCLEIENSVNLNVRVPKMILQIHVENALKHGILPLDKDGRLRIKVFKDQKNLAMEVIDNGVGREHARIHSGESTGRGLAVMEQYSDLFNKYHPGKILTCIEDLYSTCGNPEGTKVRITLSEIYEK